MSNTVRLVIGLLIVGALAALATPELAKFLPEGATTILAAALAAVLRQMNAHAPETPPKAEEPEPPASE